MTDLKKSAPVIIPELAPVVRNPLYRPALLDTLRDYSAADLRRDAIAGVIVGIVALPLAIALAIAVGARPESGLYTAIVGGGIIAALGGSRTQVAGPTAAFIVILAPILSERGELGLMAAGLMAGIILILMGAGRLGSLIKYVPYPVTTGFTSGIAVTIATIQIKDIFGLHVGFERIVQTRASMAIDGKAGEFVQTVAQHVSGLPEHFHEKVAALYRGFIETPSSTTLHTGMVGLLTLAILVFFRASCQRRQKGFRGHWWVCWFRWRPAWAWRNT